MSDTTKAGGAQSDAAKQAQEEARRRAAEEAARQAAAQAAAQRAAAQAKTAMPKAGAEGLTAQAGVSSMAPKKEPTDPRATALTGARLPDQSRPPSRNFTPIPKPVNATPVPRDALKPDPAKPPDPPKVDAPPAPPKADAPPVPPKADPPADPPKVDPPATEPPKVDPARTEAPKPALPPLTPQEQQRLDQFNRTMTNPNGYGALNPSQQATQATSYMRDASPQLKAAMMEKLPQATVDAAVRKHPETRDIQSPKVQQAEAGRQVEVARADLAKAQQARGEADRRLNDIVARAGPALKPEQKAALVKAFKDKHADVYKAEQTAAAALKDKLQSPALAGDDKTLRAGYGDLAKSSESQAALDWASQQAAADPAKANDPELQQIAGTAAGTLAPTLLEQGKDALDGLKTLKDKLDPFIKASKAGSEIKKSIDTAVQMAEALSKSPADFDKLRELQKGWEAKGPIAKALGVYGVLAGAKNAVTDVQQQKYAAAVKDIANTVKGGMDILAGASRSLADAARSAGALKDVARVEQLAKLATRFAPAVGAIASAASFAERVGRKDQDVGNAVGMVGDLVSVMGSAVEAIPGGQVPGAVINAVGTAISALGDGASALIQSGKRTQEEKDLFQTANRNLAANGQQQVPQSTVDAVTGQFSQAATLSNYGMSPQQIQDLIAKHPNVASLGGGAQGLTDAAKALGVPPEKFGDFLDRVKEKGGSLTTASADVSQFTETARRGEYQQAYQRAEAAWRANPSKPLHEYVQAENKVAQQRVNDHVRNYMQHRFGVAG